MSIRSILVPVRGDGKGENVLDAALAMAKDHNAHVDVFHARMRPQDMTTFGAAMSGFMRGEIAKVAEQHAAEEESRVKTLFEDYCATHDVPIIDKASANPEGVSASWHEEQGRQADMVGRWGRLTDIIFVAQPDGILGANTFEAALMSTSRPVVTVPPKSVTKIGKAVAVAWNGSAEVAGAVTTSRSIVEAAEKVVIFSAPEEAEHGLTAGHLAEYLKWHGCDSEIISFDCPGHEVGQNLLAGCQARGIDLMIMGGYGQIRRHELMMGGVTEHVIKHADIPVLLRH